MSMQEKCQRNEMISWYFSKTCMYINNSKTYYIIKNRILNWHDANKIY